MWLYSSSREKSNRWKSRSQFQMFSLISGGHVCAPPRTPTWRFHTDSENFSRTFRQITQQRNTIQIWDLLKFFSCVSFITLQILGFFHQLVLILIFYDVTVKTKNRKESSPASHAKYHWVVSFMLQSAFCLTFFHLRVYHTTSHHLRSMLLRIAFIFINHVLARTSPILETVYMSLILRKSLFSLLGTVSNFSISRSNSYRMETPNTSLPSN